MSSFDPTKHAYIILKITHENCEKYCTDLHVPVESHIGFDLFEEDYVHAGSIEDYDYVCSSDEEFDQLMFLHHLEN